MLTVNVSPSIFKPKTHPDSRCVLKQVERFVQQHSSILHVKECKGSCVKQRIMIHNVINYCILFNSPVMYKKCAEILVCCGLPGHGSSLAPVLETP